MTEATAMAAAMTVLRGDGRGRAVRHLGREGEDADVGDWRAGGAAFLFQDSMSIPPCPLKLEPEGDREMIVPPFAS